MKNLLFFLALTGISLFNTYAQSGLKEPINQPDFIHHIQPILNKTGCNTTACHGNSQNRLSLSMFSGMPDKDYNTIINGRTGRFVNQIEPEKSLLVKKCNGDLQHVGGTILSKEQSELLTKWIATGMAYDLNPKLKIKELQIQFTPEKALPGEDINIKTYVISTDGTKEDVTQYCHFESNNKLVATRNKDGLHINNFGVVGIMARYNYHFGVKQLFVKQDAPDSLFPEKQSNQIDKLIGIQLKTVGIPPSPVCDDATFLRRVYLNLTGRLPELDKTIDFLNDKSPNKRDVLIDHLLASTEFVEYLTLKWGDLLRIKSEFPSNLWPNAVQAYHRCITQKLKPGVGYDNFATELLLATGSNFRDPEVNYYRAFGERIPTNISENTGLLFMGKRYECARCHAHPKEKYMVDKKNNLDYFFTQLTYKKTAEWKEEIVFIDHDKILNTDNVRMPDGKKVSLKSGTDFREPFVSWLTSNENPYFAKTMVNRIWFWLMGRGIVHEPDDFRSTNPPSHPELLKYLEEEFVNNDFDIRHIYKLILKSNTYQSSSATNKWNKNDETCFSHYPVQRLGAEQLIDAICDITGTPEFYISKVPEPFTFLPESQRATALADGSVSTPFLKLFGRPSRNVSYENDRNNSLTTQQVLYMLNSEHLYQKINSGNLVEKALEKNDNDKIIEFLYLTILSHYPEQKETQLIKNQWEASTLEQENNIEDLIWALINSKAFIFQN